MAYNQTTIDALNAIITELESIPGTDVGEYLPKLNNDMKLWNGLCGILAEDGWINSPQRYNNLDVMHISRSNQFFAKLLKEGKYVVSLAPITPTFNTTHNHYSAKNLIVGDVGTMNVNQNTEFASILKEIRDIIFAHADVSSEDRTEIIELLTNINEAFNNGNTPDLSWLNQLKKYESVASIGSLIVDLISMLPK